MEQKQTPQTTFRQTASQILSPYSISLQAHPKQISFLQDSIKVQTQKLNDELYKFRMMKSPSAKDYYDRVKNIRYQSQKELEEDLETKKNENAFQKPQWPTHFNSNYDENLIQKQEEAKNKFSTQIPITLNSYKTYDVKQQKKYIWQDPSQQKQAVFPSWLNDPILQQTQINSSISKQNSTRENLTPYSVYDNLYGETHKQKPIPLIVKNEDFRKRFEQQKLNLHKQIKKQKKMLKNISEGLPTVVDIKEL